VVYHPAVSQIAPNATCAGRLIASDLSNLIQRLNDPVQLDAAIQAHLQRASQIGATPELLYVTFIFYTFV